MKPPCLHRLLVALLCVATSALLPTAAAQAGFEGHGDTGWRHSNKRDCCADAVALAQQESSNDCLATGGVPMTLSGARRGLCDWEARGDVDNVVYRCIATATVYCR